jgi:hypothetical protein
MTTPIRLRRAAEADMTMQRTGTNPAAAGWAFASLPRFGKRWTKSLLNQNAFPKFGPVCVKRRFSVGLSAFTIRSIPIM